MARWLIPCLIGLLVLALRAPQTFSDPQFWAEDGALFYAEAKNEGVVSLFYLHAGTLTIIPRLAGLIETWFSAVHAPTIGAALCVFVTLWTIGTIATARLKYAPALASLCLLVPHSGEIYGSMTHIQWVLAPALLVVAMSPSPEFVANKLNQIAFVLLASLTGPFSVFCAPLFALRLWRHRDAHSVLVSAVALSGGFLTISLAVVFYVPQSVNEPQPLATLIALFTGWFGTLAFGHYIHLIPQIALAALFAGAVGLVFTLRDWKLFFAAGLFLACAILLSGFVRFWRWIPSYFDFGGNGDRYFYLPRLVVLWAIAVLILESTWRRFVGLALAVIVVVNFWHWERRRYPYVPWKEHAWRIDRGEALWVPINPKGWNVIILSRDGQRPAKPVP